MNERTEAAQLDEGHQDALGSALEAESDVLVAYLFGSSARGRTGPLSDIDVAVLLDGEASLEDRGDKRLRLSRRLADALGDDRVDLVLLNGADPDIAYRVVRDGIVIFSRDDRARLSFEVGAIDRYLDLRPFREAQDRALRERIRDGRYGRPRRPPK